MVTHDANNSQYHKVADLTISEFRSLLLEIQTEALTKALKEIIPQKDPDEDVYWTAKEAGAFLGLSRQTIQEKKARKLIKFFGEGRIQRTTKAECKNYLKQFGVPLQSIKRREEEERKKKGK